MSLLSARTQMLAARAEERILKIGDLVMKTSGYGHDQNWTGVVLDFRYAPSGSLQIEVLTEDGIEIWMAAMVEVVNENR